MTIDFTQIYFKDEQLAALYPFSTAYKNETLTAYFENQAIADLVPKSTADKIGVCSWRLKEKRNESSSPFILNRKYGHSELTQERIETVDYDVAILCPRNPSHNVLHMSANWHGKAWVDAFEVFRRWLYSHARIKVPDFLTNIIYENHFIARREIYQDYVKTLLIPAMQHMDTDPVYLVDAGYAKRKREQDVKEYTAKTGRTDWPIAPFILERLFSIYLQDKKYNVIPL